MCRAALAGSLVAARSGLCLAAGPAARLIRSHGCQANAHSSEHAHDGTELGIAADAQGLVEAGPAQLRLARHLSEATSAGDHGERVADFFNVASLEGGREISDPTGGPRVPVTRPPRRSVATAVIKATGSPKAEQQYVSQASISTRLRYDQPDAISPQVRGREAGESVAQVVDAILSKLTDGGIGLFQVPTMLPGYSFDAASYLANPPPHGQMEMHALPHGVVLDVIREAGCELLDESECECTGIAGARSIEFLVRKAGAGGSSRGTAGSASRSPREALPFTRP